MVKNSWFRIQKFSVKIDLIYEIFFLLERASQDAVHDVALFFLSLDLYVDKMNNKLKD